MTKQLHYFTRSVYGNFNAYLDESNPETCAQVEAIRQLTGRKTLLGSDMRAIEALGFELIQVVDPKALRMARV